MRSAKRRKVKVKVKKKRKTKAGPTPHAARHSGLSVGVRMLLWAFLVVAAFTLALWGLFALNSAQKQESPPAPQESSQPSPRERM